MAIFDLAGLTSAVRLFEPSFVAFSSSEFEDATQWKWISSANHRLVVRGTGFTYVNGHATAGTATSIGFDLGANAATATEMTITGLSLPVTTLDDGADSFWRVLDGNDTITGPLKVNMTTPGRSYVYGDGINGRNGATGGNDSFDSGDTDIVVVGDVFYLGDNSSTLPALIYFGGNDTFDSRTSDLTASIIGDVHSVSANGKLFGGDDSIILRSATTPTGIGDAFEISSNNDQTAEIVGGDDVIDATQMTSSLTSLGASLIGDVDTLRLFSRVTGGEDKLYGSAFNDTLTGDVLENTDVLGALGGVIGAADELHGNDGSDSMVGDVRFATGTVYGGDDIMYGGNGVDEMLGECLDDTGVTLIGGNDRIYGGAGGDFLSGQSGNDVLDGGTGKDTMLGGTGNDQFYVDDSSELVVEFAGEGSADRVNTATNYTLLANQEIELFSTTDSSSTKPLNLTGNNFANTILGNNGANILNGGGGIDRLTGLKGNDQYFVDNPLDVVIEAAGGGATDRVYTTVTYALAANQQIEILTTTNSAAVSAINLTGNTLANIIVGNNGANSLNGGGGIDQLTGYLGNDLYYVDNFADVVIEAANNGTGDRVLTSVNYVLADNQQIELFSTTNNSGVSAINLVGNNLANTVLGNNGVNVMGGGLGNDVLTGGLGADQFRFSTTITGGSNIDTIADFVHLTDDIQLAQSIFTGIGATLDATELRQGTTATTTSQRIVYDSATGNLFFDSDGSGATAQVQFAKVTAGIVLDVNDFIMV